MTLTVFNFGAFGRLLRRYDYPVAPTAIGLILGKMAEGELLRSYQTGSGRFSYLLGRPITLIFAIHLLISLFSGPLIEALLIE